MIHPGVSRMNHEAQGVEVTKAMRILTTESPGTQTVKEDKQNNLLLFNQPKLYSTCSRSD